MQSLVQTSSRQREIIETVFRYGWDYMRRLLTGGKTDEPELPPPAILQNILADLGPVYVKLGQLLSTRPELLPPDYIDALSELQSNVPPVDWTDIKRLIEQELSHPLEEVFATIESQPVAAGSIAQTHKATLKEGQTVALKVQRPGLDAIVNQDIALIQGIADLVSGTDFGQYYDVVSLTEEFSNALRTELDFTQEASNTERLRHSLAQARWFEPEHLVIPAVYWELTTPKLLALEWLEGVPLLEARLMGQRFQGDVEAERQAISTLLFRAFFYQFLVEGFFHADPHPGNLFYLNDGRIGLLDCGMVGCLDPRIQSILTELILAIANSDAQRCTQLTLRMAEPLGPVNLVRLQNDYDRLLRRYYNLSLEELNTSEAFYEILQAGRRNNLRWPSNIGLYAKALANLEGVGQQFNPSLNFLDEIRPLTRDLFWQQLVGDDPWQTLLRTGLEFRNLSLESPRQFAFLLNRLSRETFKWNLDINGLNELRYSLDNSANRLSFSIVVGALIIGAAIISSTDQAAHLYWISTILFGSASFLGLWLIVSILRAGRLR